MVIWVIPDERTELNNSILIFHFEKIWRFEASRTITGILSFSFLFPFYQARFPGFLGFASRQYTFPYPRPAVNFHMEPLSLPRLAYRQGGRSIIGIRWPVAKLWAVWRILLSKSCVSRCRQDNKITQTVFWRQILYF